LGRPGIHLGNLFLGRQGLKEGGQALNGWGNLFFLKIVFQKLPFLKIFLGSNGVPLGFVPTQGGGLKKAHWKKHSSGKAFGE